MRLIKSQIGFYMIKTLITLILFLIIFSGCTSIEVSKKTFNSHYTVTIEHSTSASTQAVNDEAIRYCKQFGKIANFNFKNNDNNTTFRCD